jgi:hypothetical protein
MRFFYFPVILVFALMALAFRSPAQTTFEKCIGYIDDDRATGAIATSDGGFLIIGTTMDIMTTRTDIILVKIDSLGNAEWTKRIGKPISNDIPESVTLNWNKEIVVSGTMDNIVFLRVWDNAGDLKWADSVFYAKDAVSVVATLDSCYTLCGYSGGVWICKVRTNFEIAWLTNLSTNNYPYLNCIIQNPAGAYVMCGNRDVLPYPGRKSFLYALKPDGSYFWQQLHGSEEESEKGLQIRQTRDGGYLYCGWHSDSYLWPSNGDALIVKTNAGGQAVWSKTMGGPLEDCFYSFDTTADGGYVFCGTTGNFGHGHSDVWLVKTNSSGDTVWTRTFGGEYDDEGMSVITMPDGGFFICGSATSFWNSGYDLYIIRTDKDGIVKSASRKAGFPDRTDLSKVPSSLLPKE